MKPTNEILTSQERQARLEALVFDPLVVASGDFEDDGLTVGIPGEDPLCTVVPCINHRVKAPIGFGLYGNKGQLVLVTYELRADIHVLRGNQSDGTGTDVLRPILEILAIDLGAHAFAYGYRGAHIAQTSFDEFTMSIENVAILKAYTKTSPAGVYVKTTNRGMAVIVTSPAYNAAYKDTMGRVSFKQFAKSATPSMMAASWKEELKQREKRKVNG